MFPYRSLLFVPGHKESWVDKGVASGAHALILDLEDAVPEGDKALAREVTAASVDRLGKESNVGVVVRVNALDTPHFGADLEAVVRPGLTAVLVPKVYDVKDLVAFDALVRHFEIAAGMPVGTVGLVPSFETAKALQNVEQIAAGPRVVSLMAAAAKDADISREVGFTWTPGGEETLYLRSRVVLAARAAGLRHVVLGLWQDLHNLDGLREFAEANHRLGFGGQVIIHPSHAPVVNEAYSLSDAVLSRYAAMVKAYEDGAAAGHGAVMFDGEHIDLAHAENARQILQFHTNQSDLSGTTGKGAH
ncbi:CoA ester lyase [Nocardioides aromaticivorans]|uniref:CoA ester lyase n=1 Tax=Nocardioides aromaticivorans TaxID=200618 RepID=A0ABX7PSP2_9ACTN|nr:CoA ester lyase [Nocardioides aromaticivorans]QSR28798.1 CoA ester lyase [Nocardioides aromaticivorans]